MTVVTGHGNAAKPPVDQPARERILSDLDTNMLVEAGAGSGKTTSLVARMHALILRGEPVERIAAVTFTRKAAHELRERFQFKLEMELRHADPESDAWRRCDRALRDFDRAFLGTIHSFCSRILREHPLDVALDPNFAEVSEDEWEQLTRGFWSRWLERCKRDNDEALAEFAAIGIDPRLLYDGFKAVMKYQDVEFPLVETGRPDGATCRTKLEALIARARAMMPTDEPPDGFDGLMALVRRLEYHQQTSDWRSTDSFCAALETIAKSHVDVTQKRWSDVPETKSKVKALKEEFLALLGDDITALLTCWREHRYPVVMRFLSRAAAEFTRERHETGQLGFEDLLIISARLLRDHPRVRDALGERYRRLLVDEFQDTDPIQAEVCFLLASESTTGNDWRSVTPRAGGIFLVGDPKQSIYRFRRADIQVYEFAKARMGQCGAVLALTSNFRSVAPIGEFVNRYFAGVFPVAATDVQAPFSSMHTEIGAVPTDGVSQYWVRPEKGDKNSIVRADSAQVASWIAARVASGDCAAGDFLILTDERYPLASYARELAARNIPVSTSGAQLLQERELTELLVVLHAVADPDNPILIAAALEGLFFGCSPADLYDARVAGLHFSIVHQPATSHLAASVGLLQLHEWWKVSQRHASDVLVERVLDDTGLLCFAASQSLGDARAGALLQLVEVLRAASTTGASGITDAIDRIDALLTQDSDGTPLRPGRTDAVRVMNLHKAKGLEARIVVLAAPIESSDHEPGVHIVRTDVGAAHGGIVISGGKIIIAQPVGWREMAASERSFAAAEDQRLLYVATTRAMRELVVSRCERPKAKSATEAKPDTSAWSPLGTVLGDRCTETIMLTTAAPGRRRTERTSQEVEDAITLARSAVARASIASISHQTVTESAKEQREMVRAYDVPPDRSRGKAWGRVVHRCIEAAGRGRSGESLSAFVAAVVSDEGLGADNSSAVELLLGEIRQSELWKRLTSGAVARFELPVMRLTHDADSAILTEGVIDAAVLAGDEWLIVDWKTDAVGDVEWAKRHIQYEKQVGAYGKMLNALTGQPTQFAIQRVVAEPTV
ncbi:MAG: UvrD-helicase domain-containing protein [Gemmatimonadaceae bacterium]